MSGLLKSTQTEYKNFNSDKFYVVGSQHVDQVVYATGFCCIEVIINLFRYTLQDLVVFGSE